MSKIQIIITPDLEAKEVEIEAISDGCGAKEMMFLISLTGVIRNRINSDFHLAELISDGIVQEVGRHKAKREKERNATLEKGMEEAIEEARANTDIND